MAISTAKPLDGGSVRLSGSPARASGQAAGTDRRAVRRAVSVSLLLMGVFTLASGFWSLFLPRGSWFVLAHASGGVIFGVLCVVHARFNRNAIRLYLRDFGWSPAVLRFVMVAAISLLLLVPVLRLV